MTDSLRRPLLRNVTMFIIQYPRGLDVFMAMDSKIVALLSFYR
jgi:alpha-D-ribose 1-methylphosphonate 5-triphosphate synthase subunit PhnH